MILITGGCGYLGSHCAVELIKLGYEVVVLDNLVNSDIKTFEKINFLTNKNNIFEKADITNHSDVAKIFKKYSFETVFHFAGLKSIVESIENPSKYFFNNLLGTILILEEMRKTSVKKIIFSSSATVYGNKFNPPWKEDLNLLMPNNPYAQTKYMIENILESIVSETNEFHVGILRYFNPIGAHRSGLLGEDIKKSVNLIPSILNSIINAQTLNVFGNDYDTIDGTAIRDYIHVSDLIDGHLKAFNYINKYNGFNIWNLGSGEGYSVKQIVNKFEMILGQKIPVRYQKRREGDLQEYWADITKAKLQLKWKVKYNLDDMIRDNLKSVNP